PSVVAGGSYQIIGFGGSVHDFGTVGFPQDIRNCSKCHDGADSATPQGDNWKTQPTKEACGSCHDNVNFATGLNHAGGVQVSNSTCVGCHAQGGAAGPVENSHVIPEKVAGAKFKFNLVSVTGGNTPVVKFSVTDPTNGNAPYNITTDTAFTQVPSGVSRLALIVGWNTVEFSNVSSGVNPGQPITVFPTPTCGGPASGGAPASTDWVCTGPAAGVYTLTKQTALPAGAAGTGRVGLEGHPAAQDKTGAWTVRVPVKSVVKDFAITGTLTARRNVVDIAKCDKCHDQLSLHGANRTDEPQLCVICHNPSDTDVNRRPKTGGVPNAALTADGKKMEAIDFKGLIHAIHAGRKDDPATTTVEGHGFRNKGIVVYGFGGSVNDFSHIRFPGILSDCAACHVAGTSGSYELAGIWQTPTASGILGSTIDAAPTATDAATLATELANQALALKISPTAAVCSSCHDSTLSQAHMEVNGGLFSATQASIANGGTIESCALCHGPSRIADVKKVHGVK
ncbi:MAG: OmcA/MtrC family decaheme c-type cytochrome, partial [Betaproteobacteria bacterium]|nr:OmcA/MtrC family decaheme c-type cytochrome [Betaproteobacteria bacterium]